MNLRVKGDKLEDIFTKEEIKKYKAEDQLRAGKTQYVETGKDTATLYLSSAYTKTIAALGAGAISVISALTGGLVGAGVGGFLGSIAASNIDTSKGIYIKLKTKKNAAGEYVLTGEKWGYQRGDFMDRLKYSLKVGILALLLFCTLNYLVPMQSNAFSIIIYSSIFAVLLMLLVYIFLGILKK